MRALRSIPFVLSIVICTQCLASYSYQVIPGEEEGSRHSHVIHLEGENDETSVNIIVRTATDDVVRDCERCKITECQNIVAITTGVCAVLLGGSYLGCKFFAWCIGLKY